MIIVLAVWGTTAFAEEVSLVSYISNFGHKSRKEMKIISEPLVNGPELDKDKIIVTACPHKDRTILAMVYLRAEGYNSQYLVDGLPGFAKFLRRDTAKYFFENS